MDYVLPSEVKNLIEAAKGYCNGAQEVHNLMNAWGVQTILGHIHHLEVSKSPLKSLFIVPYYTLLANNLQAALMSIIYQRAFIEQKNSKKAENQMLSDVEKFWKDALSFQLFADAEEKREKETASFNKSTSSRNKGTRQ